MAQRGRPRLYPDEQTMWREVKRRQRHPTLRAVPMSTTPGSYVADLAALVASGQRFGTIYADPPWQYDNQATRASTNKHYLTMTLADLCALPVRDLALPQAHLHLWTTTSFLFEAQPVLEAWGCTYKPQIVWGKTAKDGKTLLAGLGSYWRNCHEILLLGVRGSLTARTKHLPSVVLAPRLAHSEKPETFRDLVEQLSPGPYLELFGRAVVPGWTVYGNQQIPRSGRLFKDTVG